MFIARQISTAFDENGVSIEKRGPISTTDSGPKNDSDFVFSGSNVSATSHSICLSSCFESGCVASM
ncbi:MAG: hypothetical protein AAB736_00840, partial [Patescibacteria group bacterium]